MVVDTVHASHEHHHQHTCTELYCTGLTIHVSCSLILCGLSWSLLCSCRFWYALHKLESVFCLTQCHTKLYAYNTFYSTTVHWCRRCNNVACLHVHVPTCRYMFVLVLYAAHVSLTSSLHTSTCVYLTRQPCAI